MRGQNKICPKCSGEFPLTKFGKDSKTLDGLRVWCRACVNASSRRYYNKNSETLIARKKQYRLDNLDQLLNSHLKRTYDITLVDFDKMFEEQDGCCFICGRHQSEFSRRLDVDHDHDSGQVRGLLCYSCNTKLGWFQKHQERILIYLKRNYDVKRTK